MRIFQIPMFKIENKNFKNEKINKKFKEMK